MEIFLPCLQESCVGSLEITLKTNNFLFYYQEFFLRDIEPKLSKFLSYYLLEIKYSVEYINFQAQNALLRSNVWFLDRNTIFSAWIGRHGIKSVRAGRLNLKYLEWVHRPEQKSYFYKMLYPQCRLALQARSACWVPIPN